MTAVHQRQELRTADLTSRRKSERPGTRAAPLARRLAAARVIVLNPRGDLRVVILKPPPTPAQLPDRQHDRAPAQRKGRAPVSAAGTADNGPQTPTIRRGP